MLLVQGVFRSGTTALFRTLRRDEHLACFYEPLHPDVLGHARDADAARPTHPKSSLYSEYVSHLDTLDALEKATRPSWPHWLEGDDRAPALKTYLDSLAETGKETLLQFNRAFWMVPWLAETFPESTFVHLVRDPRSVVWSQLTTASGTRVRMDWPVLDRWLPFSSGTLRRAFSEHAFFGAYHLDEYFERGLRLLENGEGDAVLKQALRRLEGVRGAKPYVKALALWGAQVDACQRHARAAFGDRFLWIRYEDFYQAPGELLRSIYALQDRPLSTPVREYARSSITADRLRRWTQVSDAEQYFREGLHRAQIADVMRELGYDPS